MYNDGVFLMIEHNGVSMTISELARRCTVSRSELARRYKSGLRGDELIKARKSIKVSYKGKLKTLVELSVILDIPYPTLKGRYTRGLRGIMLYTKTHGSKGKVYEAPKLDTEMALEIFKLANSGEYTQFEIAAMYDIHQSTVSDIKTGKRWSNVTGITHH